MSIQSEINRIKSNVASAYTAVQEKGGALPEEQNSANLAAAVLGIPAGGARPGGALPPDPAEVYRATRPADWLPMPEPQDDELYLLLHIPDGASSLLAFTATCTGSYTVAAGTVENGAFVPSDTVSIASGKKYEAELLADDFGNLTSTGMKQCMVKVSGTNILTWVPSAHSRKTLPADFAAWNIVDISCRLPKGSKVSCGSITAASALRGLRYFTWAGKNNLTNMSYMLDTCLSLLAVLELDTSKVTNMTYSFNNCASLLAIPALDTSKATNMSRMFNGCTSLVAIPEFNTSNAINMSRMFYGCYSLMAVPALNTAKVTDMGHMFNDCRSLAAVTALDTSKVTTMANTFNICNALARLTLNPAAAGWGGYAISLANCSLGHQALAELFDSLPTITSPKTLTLTGNPGVSELTDAEKAAAAEKNWTLAL